MSENFEVVYTHPSGATATFIRHDGELDALAKALDAEQFWVFKTVKTLRPTGSALWLGINDGPGAHHEFDLQGKDIAGHEIVDVLRTEKIAVGGQSVSADVVRTTLTFSGSASGSIVLDQWFVRSARVVGKEHLEGDVRASLVRLTSKYDAVLRRLTP